MTDSFLEFMVFLTDLQLIASSMLSVFGGILRILCKQALPTPLGNLFRILSSTVVSIIWVVITINFETSVIMSHVTALIFGYFSIDFSDFLVRVLKC